MTGQGSQRMPRHLGNRENALRRFGFGGAAEFRLGNIRRFQAGVGDERAKSCASLCALELRGDEDAANLQAGREKLLDGANAFGDEKLLFLPRFTAPEIARKSQKSQAASLRTEWNGFCLLKRQQFTAGVPMKRIFASLALTIALTACGISQQQEVAMGQDYAQQINSQLPIVRDPEINRYINVLGDEIARRTARADLDWRFYIVDSREVNAFAVPGGFIYVNRGLIERTTKMDELAGVLGHEIGHVVRRHSIEQMEKAQGANIGVTLACVLTSICNSQIAQAGINIAGGAVFARFSRQDELEADQEAIGNTVRAGISPQGIVTMFQKLINERRSRPSAVAGWFATHPLEEDRIQLAQTSISTIPAATRSRLSSNSSNYNSFVARIRSLPPPPPPRRQ